MFVTAFKRTPASFGREISGDEKAQAVAFIGDNELAPEAGKGDPAGAVVDRLGIGLSLRKVEFVLCGAT